MDKSAKILDYVRSKGEMANHAEKIGATAGGDVYALSLLDGEGMPLPIGLPVLVISKGDNYTLITGDESLELLRTLGLKE